MRVKVATLPEGEDPDTLVRRGGADALLPVLRDAVDVLDRKIQLLERKGWSRTNISPRIAALSQRFIWPGFPRIFRSSVTKP